MPQNPGTARKPPPRRAPVNIGNGNASLITILYQPHKRIFPYGYPAAFVPNIHHQYILILENEQA